MSDRALKICALDEFTTTLSKLELLNGTFSNRFRFTINLWKNLYE